MSIIQEFKEFAVKGNMMDLAIGVIIWWCFWQNRGLFSERYYHATYHCNYWWWC